MPSRRTFVQGLALGGSLGALGLLPRHAWAGSAERSDQALSALTGNKFDLAIGQTQVNFTGRTRTAITVNGTLPAPVLRMREGESIVLRVRNTLPTSTSIHWHGILLPTGMDGVPGLSFDGIEPGETFEYRFDLKQSGTYWYHSHTRFQEQSGLYGPIVIEPLEGERFPTQRDHVVMLSDWSDEDPETIFGNLKKMADYYNFNEPTAIDFTRDVSRMGLRNALAKRRMWNQMRMSPTDLGDVTGHAYTYLINGVTPNDNWTGLFSPGEKVRLRFINGSAMSIFDVRIPGLKMIVVAADGQDIEPISVDEFRIAVAETYDVIVEPDGDRPYTLFAQSIDRQGFARGTLAPRHGMQADVPALDKPQWLTMTDMMGAMTMTMAGMDMGTPAGKGMDGMAIPGIDGGGKDAPMAHHARTEYGPGVDMRVDAPRTNLDDPGIGLRDNGRRVLAYADLHTIGGPLDPRQPGREIELHLTGNMERYMWSFDGQKFSDAKPIHFRHGERVRVILSNDSMMPHPIHLHGLWSELESPSGEFQVRKHTIMVQPAQRISYLVNADALGRWAYHCHLLYHMEAGMFREVVVS
ncbi:copper resistance system multicopper oxidase [Thermomonas sp.]|uniref:copper resistance system multicopper oxidase n=1 Tax=Thermomonas sp. TaxID=1971895 RepID=UPI0024888393|nr:copper resistance system multicopper oxidase [Thermomonas sp.]MDI1253327.1 copper resistance system multicopper oxidase [Thermomonas sp.]